MRPDKPMNGISYWVDLINGDDANDGLTPETAITHTEALRRADGGSGEVVVGLQGDECE